MKTLAAFLFFLTFFAFVNKAGADTGLAAHNLEAYSQEELAGKGMLYLTGPIPTVHEIEITFAEGSRQPVYVPPMKLNAPENGIGTFSLRVLEKRDSEYLISSKFDAVSKKNGSRYDKRFILTSREAKRLGLKYIDFQTLHKFLADKPEMARNILGSRLAPDKPSGGGKGISRRVTAYILKTEPKTDASFVKQEIPMSVTPAAVTVLEKKEGWFRLKIQFRFFYNASTNPKVCARSLFDRTYTGWWKAPLDKNGFPYLFPSMVKHEAWELLNE